MKNIFHYFVSWHGAYAFPAMLILLGLSACKPETEDTTVHLPDTPTSVSAQKDSDSNAPRMNVLLIVVDALRADRIDAERSGVPIMPGLKAFAAKSWRFTRALSQATWTKPSMCSLMTSLYPSVHNVQYGIQSKLFDGQDSMADILPDSIQTMAEYLKVAGYSTSAVQSNANLKDEFGVAQGFDEYYFKPYPEITGALVTELAQERVDKLKTPFFVYAHYMDTHAKYDPPFEYREIFAPLPPLPSEDESLVNGYFDDYYIPMVLKAGGINPLPDGWRDFSPAGREYVKALYDCEARYVDKSVMDLINHVQQAYPATIIIVTADHGEELWEHGSIGHGRTVYQEVAHVPLIIHAPGEQPRTLDAWVELIDIFPTIASLLALPPSTHWQGMSLDSAQAVNPERAVFVETRASLREMGIWQEAVLTGDMKLILDRAKDTAAFFNLLEDPWEMSATQDGADMREMRKILDGKVARDQKHPMRQENGVAGRISQETIEQIESIGYTRMKSPHPVESPGGAAVDGDNKRKAETLSTHDGMVVE